MSCWVKIRRIVLELIYLTESDFVALLTYDILARKLIIFFAPGTNYANLRQNRFTHF